MNKIKMVVTDMDGTLLNNDKKVSDRNQATIHRLQKEGVLFAIATGRSREEIKRSLDSEIIPSASITLNGAKVYLDENHVLQEEVMSQEILGSIQEKLRSRNVFYEAVCEDRVYTSSREGRIEVVGRILRRLKGNNATLKEIEEDSRFKNTRFVTEDELSSMWKKTDVHKLRIYESSDQSVSDIQSLLEGIQGIHISASNNWSLEVNTEQATKGKGVARIAEHFQIPLTEVLVIGDHLNDVPMLQVSGLSIAVGNARLEVKQQCDEIVGKNTEDGFSEAVERFVLL